MKGEIQGKRAREGGERRKEGRRANRDEEDRRKWYSLKGRGADSGRTG